MPKFITSLESLRGVAALLVAVSHSMIAIKIGGADKLWSAPIRTLESLDAQIAKFILFIANGQAAVTIFFILSGLVLGLSLDNEKQRGVRTYFTFIVKRAFRIYPAHIVASSVIALLLVTGVFVARDYPMATTWFKWWYTVPLTTESFLRNLALLSVSLNPVAWTLLTELAVGLVFPFLYVISRMTRPLVPLIMLGLLVLLAILEDYRTGIVLPHVYKFYVGLLLLRFWKANQQSFGYLWYGLAFTLLLIEGQIANGLYHDYGIIQTIGAAMLIYALIGANAKVLNFPLVRALGRQSYSFYLWHFPVLYGLSSLTMAHMDADFVGAHGLFLSFCLCAISIAATFLISTVSFNNIESPLIRMGKKLTAKDFLRRQPV